VKYFGTSFSLTLGAWRLRVRIDLEDDPEDQLPPNVHVHAPRRSPERVTSG